MGIVKSEKTPARAAPLSETTIIGWMSKNLFSSWFNAILTIVTLYIIYITVKDLWIWGISIAVSVSASASMAPAGLASLPGWIIFSMAATREKNCGASILA